MKQTYYSISDTAKKLDIEAHVLRYWEDELELDIHRNELGHRSYSEKDILTFKHIRQLKEEGFSLQDIKSILQNIKNSDDIDKAVINDLKSLSVLSRSKTNKRITQRSDSDSHTASNLPTSSKTNSPDKLGQFREIMNSIINQAISENNRQLAAMICENTSERIIKEMNYLFRTLDEDEDVRIKQLEAAIQAASLAKLEAAASGDKKKSKIRHFFKKKEN